MGPVAFALLSVTAVSVVSLGGLLTLSMSEVRVRRLAAFFVSFAAGALLGDTFIHLVPQIFADARGPDALRASLRTGGRTRWWAEDRRVGEAFVLLAGDDRAAWAS